MRVFSVNLGSGGGGGGSGDVAGPGSAVADDLASFSGTSGKIIKDSGIAAAAVVTLTGSQVLTNKTLTAPALNAGTVGTSLKFGSYHIEPSEVDAGNSSTGIALDLATGSAQKVTMTGNCTFTLSNGVAGGAYAIRILGGAGGFTIAMTNVTWLNASATAPGAPPASAILLVNLYTYDGTNYLGTFAGNF